MKHFRAGWVVAVIALCGSAACWAQDFRHEDLWAEALAIAPPGSNGVTMYVRVSTSHTTSPSGEWVTASVFGSVYGPGVGFVCATTTTAQEFSINLDAGEANVDFICPGFGRITVAWRSTSEESRFDKTTDFQNADGPPQQFLSENRVRPATAVTGAVAGYPIGTVLFGAIRQAVSRQP